MRHLHEAPAGPQSHPRHACRRHRDDRPTGMDCLSADGTPGTGPATVGAALAAGDKRWRRHRKERERERTATSASTEEKEEEGERDALQVPCFDCNSRSSDNRRQQLPLHPHATFLMLCWPGFPLGLPLACFAPLPHASRCCCCASTCAHSNKCRPLFPESSQVLLLTRCDCCYPRLMQLFSLTVTPVLVAS